MSIKHDNVFIQQIIVTEITCRHFKNPQSCPWFRQSEPIVIDEDTGETEEPNHPCHHCTDIEGEECNAPQAWEIAASNVVDTVRRSFSFKNFVAIRQSFIAWQDPENWYKK